MGEWDTVVRKHADRIAANAAESTDCEEWTESLTAIVLQMADRHAMLDLSALHALNTPDQQIARILHAIDAECIETLRQVSDPKSFPALVLEFRDAILAAVPRSRDALERTQHYHSIIERNGADHSVEHLRLCGLFDCLLKTVRDLAYVHDLAGNLLYVNDNGLRMVKYTRHELLRGLSIYDFVVPKYMDIIETRLESPGAIQRAPYTIEIYAKDGERIPVEFETRLLNDAQGNMEAIVGVARDLRLERRFQENIRRSNTYLQNIISSVPAGVLVCDAGLIIRDANVLAASLCGATSPQAIIGRRLSALTVAEDEAEVVAAAESVLGTGVEYRHRVSMQTRFGAMLNCEIILAPLVQEAHAVEGLLVLMTDLTSQLHTQRRVVQSEKLSALSEIVAGVAHELNNPLTGILGYAQLLQLRLKDPDNRTQVEHIVEEAQRCRHIVENLLSFARRSDVQKQQGDINALLRDTLAMCAYQLETQSIETSLELDPSIPKVEMSVQQMQRVLLSLISNAQHALGSISDRVRRLTIQSTMLDGAVRIRVADNGPGIPMASQSRIFDPFFTTKKVGEGTGLGLSVAYGIVHEHGGEIIVESVEGQGATFTVVLPI